MASRFVYKGGYILRKPVNSQMKWTLNLKYNSSKECKIFYVSSVFFTTGRELGNRQRETGTVKVVKVWKDITVLELSRTLNISLRSLGLLLPDCKLGPNDKIKSLRSIQEPLYRHGYKLQLVEKPIKVKEVNKAPIIQKSSSKPENLVKRPPVVTVMGHVDHGKTTLLDSLRNTFVVEQEFGGITQHIGAFSVEIKPGEKITFIDTPGHAAFTAMRSRGADVTDLVVLVIAADDGIMEQTVESIKIATAAQVPIIVAVNKIDKPTALPLEDIKQKLLWEGIQVEDQGGDVQLVPISALKKINLDLLTEVILLQAELMNLQGDPTGSVEAVVIESKKGPTGIVATLIVKKGTIRKQKFLVAGKAYARVRRMLDENGKDYTEAPPSTPVQILGWKDLPSAGDEVLEASTERQAKALVAHRERISEDEKREAERSIIEERAAVHQKEYIEIREKLRSFSNWKDKSTYYYEWNQQRLREAKKALELTGPHLKILLKTDVYGTLEVLTEILGSYNKEEECKLTLIHASVGNITPSDLELADSFGAVIYAFNVSIHQNAKDVLQDKSIDIRYHNVIYKMIDDIKLELTARIPPKDKEEINGEAEVLENFQVTHEKKKVPVAGARCIKGQLNKDSLYKILRGGEVIYEGKLAMMKNEKKVVKTIPKGMECGLLFESFTEKFKPGDRIICYDLIKVEQATSWNPGF